MTHRPFSALTRRETLTLLGLQGLAFGLAGCSTAASAQELSVPSFKDLERADIPKSVTRITVADREGAVLTAAAQGDDDARGYAWTTSNGGARRWAIVPAKTMTPEMFGALANGKDDDAAAITAALATLARGGGGTLRFKPKSYRLATIAKNTNLSTDTYRASIGIPPGSAGIRIEFNGATLVQACDAFSIGPQYRLFNDSVLPRSTLAMSGSPRRGDRTVTLRAPAPLKVGDMVMVVAGNVNKRGYTPIAELQRVAAVQGQSITFAEPLAKDYSDDGENPFGLINVNDHSIRDYALIGPGKIVNNERRTGNILQVMGLELRDIACEGRGGFGIRGRHLLVQDCSADITANWQGKQTFRPYALALDTGTCEAVITDFVGNGGDGVAYLHLHEGVADVKVEHLKLYNGTKRAPGASAVGAISILGTSWNVTIDDALVVNNPEGAGIEARELVGGDNGNRGLVVRNVKLQGVFAKAPVLVQDREPARLVGVDLSQASRLQGKRRLQVGGASHILSGIVGD